MKKTFIIILACLMAILTVTLTACGNDKTGTYYPTVNEMGDDYIYFYWIEDAANCKIYYNKLKELHPDSTHFVLIENDERFGNIVYCGTENAINAAGIRVAEIKVKV